jgi:hypothetical protein
MALSKILPASQEQYAGARNLITNGACTISQRGTSFTGSSEYTLDRFYFERLNTDQLACTVTQDSDAPDGFYNSLKVEVTTAETTLDSDEFTRVFQRLEGQDLQHLQYGTSGAKSLTLSFWVKASVTGDYAVLFYRDLTTDRSITKTYTVNSANTWEYKTITIDGDQTTATPSDNVSRFEIDWALAAGTDWTSTDGTSWGAYVSGKFAYGQTANLIGTANATWQITGVQLEVGEATPFEHRSYGDELARCQRYYEKSLVLQYYQLPSSSGAQVQRQHNRYQVQKRASATLTQTKDSGSAATSVGNVGGNLDGILHSFGGNAGEVIFFYWTADAEL